MRFDRLVLIVLLLVLPVAFWPGSTSYDAVKFTLWALAGAAWLGGLAWRMAKGRPVPRPPTLLAAAGITLLAVLAISATRAHHTGLVLRTVGLTALWLAVVRQVAVTTTEASRLHALVACAVTTGVAVCLYTLAQITGLVPGAPVSSGYPAGISTLGNQNYVSGLAAVLLWPSVILWTQPSVFRRAAAVAATVVLVITLLFARAAGPLAAVVGSVFLAGPSLVLTRRGLGRLVPRVLGLSLLFAILVGGFLFIEAMRPPPSTVEPVSIHRKMFFDNHGAVRRTNWLVAREMFRSRPWTGQGAGNYAALWPETRARLHADSSVTGMAKHEPPAAQAHNEVFQFLGETGLAGGLWLVFFCGTTVVFWRRKWPTLPTSHTKTQFLLLTAGLLVAGLHAMVSFPFHLPATALMIALIAGLTASPVFAEGTDPHPTWTPKRVLAFLPAILALLLAFGAVREFAGDISTATGQRYFAAGRMNQALVHLTKGVTWRQWPDEGSLYLGLANVAAGNPAEARTWLEKGVVEKPTFEGYLALAELSLDQKRFTEADALLTVVEQCEPYQAFLFQAAYLRGLADLRQGKLENSRRRFEALLKDDPYNQRAWLALGYQEALKGNVGQARVHYQKALEIIEWKIRDTNSGRGPDSAALVVRLNKHRETAVRALESITPN
ncbi:MAG: O-antigen ligase family protein [Candidatus Krumholzibacteriota bacterium]